MRVKTAVAQLPLPAGGKYETPSGILVDERASRIARGRGRGNLYILVDVLGNEAGRNIVAMQIAGVMRDVYFGWKGSITAGIQQAVLRANKMLFDENRNALPGEQWTAGISCAVLRDNNLYIAQAGPAAAYLYQQGTMERFPDRSPWLDADVTQDEVDFAPVGDRRDLYVGLYHTQTTPNATLLLLECESARRIAKSAWPRILNVSPIDAILNALLEEGQNPRALALVVRLDDSQTGAPVSAPLAYEDQAETPHVRGETAWEEQVGEEQEHEAEESFDLAELLSTVGLAIVGIAGGLWAAVRTFVGRVTPGQVSSQPIAPEQTAKATPTAKKARAPRPAKRIEKPPNQSAQKVLIAVAIAIPLIVAAVVLYTYLQRGQSHRAELDSLWQEATTRWQQTEGIADQETVRTLLTEAEGMLDQLLIIEPNHAEAVELRKRVQARLDEINDVKRINWIAKLQSYPTDAELNRVVVEGVHVFVMDRRNGKVYHHQLDEYQQALKPETQDNVLVSKGEQIGNLLVGDLIDMTWMPVGIDRQKANLLILESNGYLIEYDPATGERVPLAVAASEKWQYPKFAGSYFGRFYLLDPAANQIWRYAPTPDGYSSPPDEWLQAQVDLAGAVDMAIGNSIYLVYADGKMRKLTAGAPDEFDISDWDTPPDNPGAIFTRPPEDTRWVYTADRGNRRIVQSGKEGLFERQFRLGDSHAQNEGDPLGAVTSLFVDEISAHAYFLSGQNLYLAILPD